MVGDLSVTGAVDYHTGTYARPPVTQGDFDARDALAYHLHAANVGVVKHGHSRPSEQAINRHLIHLGMQGERLAGIVRCGRAVERQRFFD